MRIHGIIWLRNVVDKLAWKHNVATEEVEALIITARDMTKKERKMKRKPIPKHFANVDEAADFWDRHDLSDYLDSTKVADFDVDLQRRVFLTALEPQLAKKLTEIARKQGIATETLINVWLAEKMEETTT